MSLKSADTACSGLATLGSLTLWAATRNTSRAAGRMIGRSSYMHMMISTPASAQASASFKLLVRISVNVRPFFLAAKGRES
jgi:hypothetical protein